ncbi:MAG: c-type cytochrome [Gallionella sp.]|nr:c-type cytochrome [Gallionella sp.]
MRTRNILLASLLIALYGCQPDTSNKPAAWQLADKTGCFQCHITGKNLLGPAWQSVSERYRNNPDAEAHLMNKILNGGGGAWIDKEMPAYAEDLLTEANRKILVKYIMSLK